MEFESFDLLTKVGEGSNAERITEGWIYINNDLLGAFSANRPFPVLASGETEIVVDPGIHENGIGSATELYPFYTRFTTTVDLVEGEVTKISPIFEYRDRLTFVFVDEFTDNTIFTNDLDNNEETGIEITFEDAFEGSSGLIELTEDNPTAIIGSAFAYELPTTSLQAVFLEMNYKNEVDINVGLIGFNEFGEEARFPTNRVITPKAEWNKIYLNFDEDLNATFLDFYQFYFVMTLPEGQESAKVLFDNFKLIHFNQ